MEDYPRVDDRVTREEIEYMLKAHLQDGDMGAMSVTYREGYARGFREAADALLILRDRTRGRA